MKLGQLLAAVEDIGAQASQTVWQRDGLQLALAAEYPAVDSDDLIAVDAFRHHHGFRSACIFYNARIVYIHDFIAKPGFRGFDPVKNRNFYGNDILQPQVPCQAVDILGLDVKSIKRVVIPQPVGHIGLSLFKDPGSACIGLGITAGLVFQQVENHHRNIRQGLPRLIKNPSAQRKGLTLLRPSA